MALSGLGEFVGVHPNQTVYPIDRIEYDVTTQISALLHGVCERVCARVCMCRRNQTGNAAIACFFDVRIKTRILFALQDGNFHNNKGVIQYGL